MVTIDRNTLERWRALNSPGDTTKMIDRMEKGYPEIFARAIRLGRCSEEVYKVLTDFYEEKAEMIKQYL